MVHTDGINEICIQIPATTDGLTNINVREPQPFLFTLNQGSIVFFLQNMLDVLITTGMQQCQATNVLHQSGQKPVCRINFSSLSLGQSLCNGGLRQ